MGVNALEVRRRVMMAQPHEAVASGAVASFRTDVISPLPLEFDLLPIQEGTGDPSPENVRPITGHDGFTRVRTGKNLFGGDKWLTTGQGTVDLENRTVSGGNNSGTTIPKLSVFTKYKANTQYTFIVDFSTTATNGRPGYRFVYTDGTFENLKDEVTEAKTRRVSVFSSNASKTLKYINGTAFSGTKTFYVDGCGIFEGVLTAQQFEAYKGTSIETTFPTPPGTVYGGHVVDNGDGTGTLTVDTAFISTTWGDIGNATEYTDNIRKRMLLSVADNKNKRGDAVCNVAPTKTTGIGYDLVQMVIHESNSYVYITLPKNTASDTPVQIVYYIATPQTYTLSLDAIQSLIGQNNVWVDNADSVSVEYWGH